MLNENLDLKFEKLFHIINNEAFINMKVLGGDIPFFISAYNPAQDLDFNGHVKTLKNRLNNNGISVLEIDLYNACLELLEQKKVLLPIIENEKNTDKNILLNDLSRNLSEDRKLAPYIGKICEGNDSKIIFITGVGLVYPYIRLHVLLSKLQTTIKNRPVIIFYPGKFEGYNLELFGKLKNNYYRAYNLDIINHR